MKDTYIQFILNRAEKALEKGYRYKKRKNESAETYKRRTAILKANRTRKLYNKDFKFCCVKLYEAGVRMKEISDEFGVSLSTLYRWKNNFTVLFPKAQKIDSDAGFREIKRKEIPVIEILPIVDKMDIQWLEQAA